jgi:2-polyprenyl-3-methyl-5-hydroxy-6-metoxy-1,4-benzoquinol methylase
MNIDLNRLDVNLRLKDGIWYGARSAEVSYPEERSDFCFQIEENSFWFGHRNACIVELVKKFSPNDIIYDIGGGNGYISAALENTGIRTVLIEPSHYGALNAKKRGLQNIICASLQDLSLKPASLESTGMFDVLEHIESDADFLSDLHRFMKPGAMLYITVPAFNMLWSKEDESAGHFRRYTLSSLKKLLKNSGFETRYATYIFSFLPVPIFLFRTLPALLNIKKNSKNVKRVKGAHAGPKGVGGKLLNTILKWELKNVMDGKQILFGGSCLIAVQKK